jgi:hypothetical protein
VYNERHPETKATMRASVFRKNPYYAKEYYRRRVEATCRFIRKTRGRPRKSETDTQTGLVSRCVAQRDSQDQWAGEISGSRDKVYLNARVRQMKMKSGGILYPLHTTAQDVNPRPLCLRAPDRCVLP